MNDKIKLKGVPLENYSTYYNIDKKKSVRCYSTKQFKALYPKKNFKIVGEYPPRKENIADIEINNIIIPLGEYGKNNPLIYSPKGYIECEGEKNAYVVLHENSLLKRILLIILFLLVFFIVFYMFQKLNIKDVVNKAESTVLDLDPNATDNDPNSALVNSSGSGIQIPGFKSIEIKANSNTSQVGFVNPKGNPCYFVISLTLEDGTELYKSKMIPPGKGVYNISLEKTLPSGEYNGILKYDTFGLEGLAPMNGATVKLTVVAK